MSADRRTRMRTFTFLLALLLVACTGRSGPPATPEPARRTAVGSPVATDRGEARISAWRRDLQQLLPRMEALHPDLYHSTPKAQLQAAVRSLESTLATADDDEVLVGLLGIVARVSANGRDGHTGAFIWGTGSSRLHSLPLRVWLFSDGLHVVDALFPYRGLIGARILTVAGHSTNDVIGALDPLIPRDNASTVRLLTPRYLLIPEVLHGLGLIEAVGPVTLRVTAGTGTPHTIPVDPVSMTRYKDWAGPYGLHLPPRRGVLFLARSEEPLWFRLLERSRTLYIQYNRVESLSSEFLERLEDVVRRPSAKRIVIDIRHNFGGETHAYEPVVDILASKEVTGARRVFVITGRNTFSAASLFAAEMERRTEPVFVGEPMGGSPNLYGNARDVRLAYSGFVVSVATEFFVRSTPNDPRLTIEPDIPVEVSSSDYFAGRDPALEAILGASR